MYTIYNEETSHIEEVEEPDHSLTYTYAVKNRKKDDQVTTVVQPDLCIFCDPAKMENRAAIGAPDLLVEVLSPGNSRYDLQDKYEVYQEAGVKEYWIVDPISTSVQAAHLAEEGRFAPFATYAGDQRLGPRCLPGFSITAKDLFTQ
jgi:Uma2 family endonuclease